MEKFLHCAVPAKQLYNGEYCDFDLDSSPIAWEYFAYVYACEGSVLFSTYDITNRHGLRLLLDNNKTVVNHPTNHANRITASILDGAKVERTVRAGREKLVGDFSRLGGECDFNFNAFKTDIFTKKIAKCTISTEGEKLAIQRKLEQCTSRHHSLFNFSLMQVAGGLQLVKQGHGRYGLDRPDRFIYLLDRYFVSNEQTVLKRARNNGDTLCAYLNLFAQEDKRESIYYYCKNVYFIYGNITYEGEHITAKQFVDELIENGKRAMITAADVENYIRLANRFWKFKEKHYVSLHHV